MGPDDCHRRSGRHELSILTMGDVNSPAASRATQRRKWNYEIALRTAARSPSRFDVMFCLERFRWPLWPPRTPLHGVRGQEKQNDSTDATPLKLYYSSGRPQRVCEDRQYRWGQPWSTSIRRRCPKQSSMPNGPQPPAAVATSAAGRPAAMTTTTSSRARARAISRTFSTASSAVRHPTRAGRLPA